VIYRKEISHCEETIRGKEFTLRSPALSNKGDKKRRSLLGDTSFALVFQLKYTEEIKVTQPPLKARLCRS
jgi:hypothetical protein